MEELAKDVFTAPVSTIFVLAGVLFLFIAVIGKISGKIEPGLKARVLAGVLGSAFISIGLAMNWSPTSSPTSPFNLHIPEPTDNPRPKPTPEPVTPAGDNTPDWVPVYPAKVENLSINTRQGGGRYGGFFFLTSQSPGSVLSFYQRTLELQRWKVTKTEDSLSAVNEGGNQSIIVTSGKTIFINEWKYVVSFSEYKHR